MRGELIVLLAITGGLLQNDEVLVAPESGRRFRVRTPYALGGTPPGYEGKMDCALTELGERYGDSLVGTLLVPEVEFQGGE